MMRSLRDCYVTQRRSRKSTQLAPVNRRIARVSGRQHGRVVSQRITVGDSPWANRFERECVDGKRAYRVAK
jgi:hypothetical protein